MYIPAENGNPACVYSCWGWSSPSDWGKKQMRLVMAAHAIAAGALIIASVLAVRFVILPLWFGVLVGLLLYALTLVLTKADDGDEEAP
jgi:hypothetical protein